MRLCVRSSPRCGWSRRGCVRRVIRVHADLGGFGFRVPHSKTYVIHRQELLEIADRDELGFLPIEVLPKTVILLERPDAEDLEESCAMSFCCDIGNCSSTPKCIANLSQCSQHRQAPFGHR